MTPVLPQIDLNLYRYHLPDDRIPDKPLDDRDASKLLVYEQGNITENTFRNVSRYLPKESLLVFNNSRVFPARLHFQTPNGHIVEIFCLKQTGNLRQDTHSRSARWECMVGNARKWKPEVLLEREIITGQEVVLLKVAKLENHAGTFTVEFTWNGQVNFFELLEIIGELPLPPYMNRKADDSDRLRYQTVYADPTGSVAAPTAGLHFTERVMKEINQKKIETDFLTLHVGAGTFKPIKTDDIREHVMHNEQFVINKSLLENLINNEVIISVGTTSTRVLESLYWLGVNLIRTGDYLDKIPQWSGFGEPSGFTKKESLTAIMDYMLANQLTEISGSTEIFIVPGFKFRIITGIVTNFHQPESTLILLVAALLGDDWQKVYQYALAHDFRFLSYGDSSLLLPANRD